MGKLMITGASGGIGRALVEVLDASRVCVIGRPSAGRDDLVRAHPSIDVLDADLEHPETLERDLGPRLPEEIDGIVHLAGVIERIAISDAPVSHWQSHFALNVVASAELTRLTLPALRRSRGTVVFVNSIMSLRPAAWLAAGGYAASKAAQKALADTLRLEEPALRVTSVYPSRVATSMQEAVHAHDGAEYRAADHLAPGRVAEVIARCLEPLPGIELSDITVTLPRSA